MQPSDIPSAAPPQDAYERERTENAHSAPWRNPKPAGRYNLVVIGGGPAGLVAARVAASMGAKVQAMMFGPSLRRSSMVGNAGAALAFGGTAAATTESVPRR